MSQTNKKIGFLMGTFDPIHNGHLHILKQTKTLLDLDLTLLVPLFDAPHKDNFVVASIEERLAMCEMACHHTDIQTSHAIINNKIKGYSIDLITVIKEAYPQDRLYYILGSDVFKSILEWTMLEQLIPLVDLAVVVRNHEDLEEIHRIKDILEKRGATVHITSFPIVDISSTFIKKNFNNHQLVKDMIPIELEDYLKKTRLYDSTKD